MIPRGIDRGHRSMNVSDVLYLAITIAVFAIFTWIVGSIDERKLDARR